jgi:N-acetylglucosaminyldiphosphoundecaprenol N-acetyl-beta-D-mannosaminyltransferase
MIKKDRYISTILGVKVDRIQRLRVLEKTQGWLKTDKKRYIVTVNPEILVAASGDKEFRRVLNQADMAIIDGVGLAWVLRMKGYGSIERVAGADLMNALIAKASSGNKKVFLLGGGTGVVQRAAETLKGKYPRLKIEVETGPIDITKTSKKQNQVIHKKINQFKPDLLFVAFGHQKQEKWIADNLRFLRVKVAMGVGGSFDYLVKPGLRAPIWVQGLQLEWLWRLVSQPWRIKRQLSLVKFVWLSFKEN